MASSISITAAVHILLCLLLFEYSLELALHEILSFLTSSKTVVAIRSSIDVEIHSALVIMGFLPLIVEVLYFTSLQQFSTFSGTLI